MRKHILGLTVFGWVAVFFVGLYSFFSTLPIPHIGEVEKAEPFVYTSHGIEPAEEITYKILSAKFNRRTKRLTSVVKLYWNGEKNLPKKIYAHYKIRTDFVTNNVNFYGTTILQ